MAEAKKRTSRTKRAKPKVLPLSPGSDRTVLRVAMALAWDALDWTAQSELEARARRVIESLQRVV